MIDDPDSTAHRLGPLPTLGELPLSEERRRILAPKIAALLDQLRQIEEQERPELEPAPATPERWDNDERR